MIWYLLYPFRGTTEAPVLGPSHPLRSAFTRYGRYAARHVVTTLLISVTVATILIYPIPFLFSTDYANGASNLPRHVWTSAQPLDHKIDAEPDVVMRSIWVHGSYMEALDREVLLGALELQDELLGPTRDFDPRQLAGDANAGAVSPNFHDDDSWDLDPKQRDTLHIINGLTNESWFFHSPLLYWSCSSENIELDPDIISTVNQRKSQPTSVNVTLRHSIVFSGKRFSDRQLLAADALVITLIHLRDSPVAQQWITRAQSLPSRIRDKWAVYPRNGLSLASQLYEFQFKPISTQDSFLLALAYALTLIYCLVSLSKLRAVKSKFGLSITVITQIAVSIMSSFTVCAILDVDLSRIPRAAYPLAVLSLSLENIFRLINAVILTPAEDSTCNRVGHAFGETVHICLASSAQNVLIFWGLSHVVAPGVSAFCIFAIVVVFFDFFYLSTFFLSVLSVDVRRTELSESLAKASLKHRNRCGDYAPQSWTEAVLQGKVALSTRISGTIVTVTFVLIAQWHFFAEDTIFGPLSRLFGYQEVKDDAFIPGDLVDVHQARSPTSWLRLQDHETAREVIQVVKPMAHSYVAQVYEPLVFVLKGSDRMPHGHDGLLPPAAYDFLHHQFVPFVVAIVFTAAAVRLLTNYLLWEAGPEPGSDSEGPDECPLLVKSFEGGHSLDVARIIASGDGHLVSIGLDRRINVWDVRHDLNSYEITTLDRPKEEFLPILAMTIDEDSRWLALLSTYHLMLWNFTERRWAPPMPIDLAGQKPEAVFFVPSQVPHVHTLVIVRRDGTMTQIWPASMEQSEWIICNGPLTCASLLVHKGGPQRPSRYTILTASRDRYLQITSRQEDGGWSSRSISLDSGCDDGGGEVHQVVGIPMLDAVLVARRDSVLLLDLKTGQVVHTFLTESIQPRSLKILHTRRQMSQPGPSGLTSLTLIYSNADTEDCVMQAYFAPDDSDEDILRVQDSTLNAPHMVWLDAVQSTKHIHCPGVWEVLPGGYVVGVHHKLKRRAGTANKPRDHHHSGLRHRRCMRGTLRQGQGCPMTWEVWIASQPGKADIFETQPLMQDEDAGKHLLISQMGPLAKVGRNAVAVGFGPVIKIVTVGYGHNHFADLDDDDTEDPLLHLGSRRRKTGLHKARTPAPAPAPAPAPSIPAHDAYGYGYGYGKAPELGVFKYVYQHL